MKFNTRLSNTKRKLFELGYNAAQIPLRRVTRRQLICRDELEQFVSTDRIYYFGKPEEYNPNFGEHQWLVDHTGEHTPGTFPKPFVCELTDVSLIGRYPIPVTDSFRVPLDAVVNTNVFDLNVFFSSLYAPKDVLTISDDKKVNTETAFLLYNYWSSGYFHWHFDSLTQLRGVQQFESITGRRPQLIVPPDMSAWQRETLRIVGYEDDDFTPWDSSSGEVDRLIIVTNQRPRPQAVQWLRERLRVHDEPPIDSNRIYVSRNDADRRRILNEEDVMGILDKYGFKKFIPGDHSVREQIAVMSNAELVVGPHGAGLTNLLHCPAETTVLEMFPESDIRGHFFTLSYKLGLEYNCLLCRSVGVDLVVDTDELEAQIVKLT